jgi:hypothetical protein
MVTNNINLQLSIINDKDRLFIMHNGNAYDLSPSQYVELNLSPTTQGVDKFLKYCAKLKKINKDFKMEVQDDWFFFCDACLKFSSCHLNGWLYEISSEKVKINYSYVWICSYMKFFFDSPPPTLYVKVEE